MVDPDLLWQADAHNVRVVETNGRVHTAYVDFYEDAYASGYDKASIGLSDGYELIEDQIESLEILD